MENTFLKNGSVDLCINCGNCYTDSNADKFHYKYCYGQSKIQIEMSKIDGAIISKIDGVKMCDDVRGKTTKCELFTTNIHPQVAKLRELDKKFAKHWNYFKLVCIYSCLSYIFPYIFIDCCKIYNNILLER